MTEIAFYHLQKSGLDQALPKLLSKTLESGERAVVLAGSQERVDALNNMLWSVDPSGWLPHGSAKEGDADRQPIWLTTEEENPNDASFLFLTDGVSAGDYSDYERCFDLFDGNDYGSVKAARDRWKALKEAGHALTYWQQNEQGRWEEKG